MLLNHHNNLGVENDRGKLPYDRSRIDETYSAYLPKGCDLAFEDSEIQNYASSSSLLPWSRVYRMTQSTESLPSPYQSKVYSSYSLSDSYDRGDVSSELHHYKVRQFLPNETTEVLLTIPIWSCPPLALLFTFQELFGAFSYFWAERNTAKALFLR